MKKKKITSKITLSQILKYPGAKEVLAKHKLPCLWCPLAKFEMENLTLGKICKMYNINLEKLLKELNQKLENEKKIS